MLDQTIQKTMVKTNELGKWKGIVEKILSYYPLTRNCDKKLILQAQLFTGVTKVVRVNNEVGYFTADNDFSGLPSSETITRCRRYWQNTMKMYLPTNEDIRIKRNLAQADYIEVFA